MITQAQYVARLRKMLKVSRPCLTCPGTIGFADCEYRFFPLKAWESSYFSHDITRDICRWCQDFIDYDGSKGRCPCLSIGPNNAIRRAHAAIKRWDEGKHKWQRSAG